LESLLLNCINNFSEVLIAAWFDHCKGRFPLTGLLCRGSNVSIFSDFDESAKDGDLGANVELAELELRLLNSL
jgi:hypothetical protein